MSTRILRSRWFYSVLGGIVLWVYLMGFPAQSPITFDAPAGAARDGEPLEWWPRDLDAESLHDALERRPFLGLALSALSLFMGAMLAGGLAFCWWSVLTGRARSVWSFQAKRPPAWTFGEVARIAALIAFVLSLIPAIRASPVMAALGLPPDSHVWIPASMIALDVFVVLAILAFASDKATPAGKAVGLSGRRMGTAIVDGLKGYLVIFPWLFLLLFITVELMRFFHWKPPLEPIQIILFRERDPLVMGLIVFLSCVLAPIAEEFFFRGVLFAAARRRLSRGAAIAVSGLAFSFIHTNPVGFLPIFLIGSLMAYLYERTGSLAAPIVVHMVHNTFLMSFGLVVRTLMHGA
jgi:membrane protease YdiL (CAAX protease family)